MNNLRSLLSELAPGPIAEAEAEKIEHLLCESWGELSGNDSGGMLAYKLLNRTENMLWEPPILKFEIERHGATVNGSVYAGVQLWGIDVARGVAILGGEKRRLVGKPAKPLKVAPLAEEIAALMLGRKGDPRLKWLTPTCVRVEISEVIPATNKQTTSSRRKRFIRALENELAPAGWRKAVGKLNTFAKI